jgi:heme-degrading monooxygenase HmoA
LFVIIAFNPALRDSAAVPELWTLGIRIHSKNQNKRNYKVMTNLIVRQKIEDLNKWKKAVNDGLAFRKASGELSFRTFRALNEPNHITVLCEWKSLAQAKEFTQSKELRERMERAGVIGQPEFFYLKEVQI